MAHRFHAEMESDGRALEQASAGGALGAGITRIAGSFALYCYYTAKYGTSVPVLLGFFYPEVDRRLRA